jgi:BirA family biotin operon repressor/biotin-[acetyl-CoA-carboxylase] ligase
MNDLAFQVLRLLAGAEFRSGQALARALGVSRASVWHAVNALEAAGLELYKVRGRGYRLARPLSLLRREAVCAALGAAAARYALEVVDAVDSTNTLALQRAQAGAPGGTVVAAEWQRAGRGRLGRPWRAGPGGALTFSVLWRFAQGAGFLAGLSLAVGVALARALEAEGAAGVALKWPNDVQWQGRKLAGILIEMQGDALGPSVAVIGIGVNVRLTDAVREAIDQAAVDLETACGRVLDRNALLARVLRELAAVLEAFARDGFAPLRAEWQRRHAHQDRLVAVDYAGARREVGRARGVAEDGALLLETAGGLRRCVSGEVSVRAADEARA